MRKRLFNFLLTLDLVVPIMMTQEVPMITQERAYTSPIWYSPTN